MNKIEGLVARLMDYDLCHDGDIDEAAKLLERLDALLKGLSAGIHRDESRNACWLNCQSWAVHEIEDLLGTEVREERRDQSDIEVGQSATFWALETLLPMNRYVYMSKDGHLRVMGYRKEIIKFDSKEEAENHLEKNKDKLSFQYLKPMKMTVTRKLRNEYSWKRHVEKTVNQLECELGDLAMEFRASSNDPLNQQRVVGDYAAVMDQLFNIDGWHGEPQVESQLPEEFMPQVYKDYWKKHLE